MPEPTRPAPDRSMTRIEKTILTYKSQDMTNRQVADLLNKSSVTIRNQLDTLRKDFGYHSTTALVAYALRNKLIE